jgi:transposase
MGNLGQWKMALVVRERYGVEYQSRTSYSCLLRLCGFSYQKSEKIFKFRSQIKVADFEEQLSRLEPAGTCLESSSETNQP